MADLRELHQRLEAALGRLDSAVQTRIESGASRGRIDKLALELDRANTDQAQLRETTTAVARRLDTTIDRLRKILGE